MATSFLTRFVEELGLRSLYHSPIDTKLLIFQRSVRLFAYGSSTLILVLYLTALGISDTQIGLFMTLTLLGDVVISFVLTLFADGLGRRRMLAIGALAMTVSGIVFGLSGNYWILLAAAIIGIISPSGNEIGPFRAIEESTLAQLTPAASRSDIFAWYTLIGTAGVALGNIVCGWTVEQLKSLDGWDEIRSYRTVFFAYAALGLVKFGLSCALTRKCEAQQMTTKPQRTNVTEEDPLLGNGGAAPSKKDEKKFLLPNISKESTAIVVKLCILFAIDSAASGLVPVSWVTAFFHRKFSLAEGKLGSLFFTTAIISSASTLVASSLSKRIGLVKTMVFTHLPSAIFLALIPIPSTLGPSMFFLILRACTQSMDAAPRSAFLAAVILPHERTVIMGLINVVKTMSQSLGPLITGLLAGKHLFWVAFITAGAMKACYDLSMLALFVNRQKREEEEEEEEDDGAGRPIVADEEDLRTAESTEEPQHRNAESPGEN